MAFLRVNGWAIPLIDGSPEEEHVLGGDFGRSFSGSPLSDEHFDKRVWAGRTPPVTELVAQAIKGAVRGLGHVWAFDSDLYSSKGLGPGATVGALRPSVAADGKPVVNSLGIAESKYGVASLAIEAATTNILAQNQRNGAEDGTTTGFAVVAGGAISSQTTQAYQGLRSLRVVTSASGDGAETTAVAASAATAYVGSVHVYVAANRSVNLLLIDDVGTIATAGFNLVGGKWNRISVTGSTDGAATNIKVRLTDAFAGGATFYLDGFQIETGTVATSWADNARAAGDLSYSPSWLAGAVDVTMNVWARMPTANPAAHLYLAALDSGVAAADNCFLYRPSGTAVVRFSTAGSTSDDLSSAAVWNGTWHMITAVLRRNPETGEVTKRLFVDGASVATSSPAATALPDFAEFARFDVGHSGGFGRIGTDGSLVDDVMVVPYAAPSELVAAWYAMGKAMSPLSRVYVDGDAMPDDPLTVLAEGKAQVSKYVAARSGGAFRSNLRMVDVELWEA